MDQDAVLHAPAPLCQQRKRRSARQRRRALVLSGLLCFHDLLPVAATWLSSKTFEIDGREGSHSCSGL